jgi:hypothetical protein
MDGQAISAQFVMASGATLHEKLIMDLPARSKRSASRLPGLTGHMEVCPHGGQNRLHLAMIAGTWSYRPALAWARRFWPRGWPTDGTGRAISPAAGTGRWG